MQSVRENGTILSYLYRDGCKLTVRYSAVLCAGDHTVPQSLLAMVRCGGRPRDDTPSPPAAPAAATAADDVEASGEVEMSRGIVHEGWVRKLSRTGLRGRAWRRRCVLGNQDSRPEVFSVQPTASNQPRGVFLSHAASAEG